MRKSMNSTKPSASFGARIKAAKAKIKAAKIVEAPAKVKRRCEDKAKVAEDIAAISKSNRKALAAARSTTGVAAVMGEAIRQAKAESRKAEFPTAAIRAALEGADDTVPAFLDRKRNGLVAANTANTVVGKVTMPLTGRAALEAIRAAKAFKPAPKLPNPEPAAKGDPRRTGEIVKTKGGPKGLAPAPTTAAEKLRAMLAAKAGSNGKAAPAHSNGRGRTVAPRVTPAGTPVKDVGASVGLRVKRINVPKEVYTIEAWTADDDKSLPKLGYVALSDGLAVHIDDLVTA